MTDKLKSSDSAALPSPQPLETLERAKTTFFYIRNLSHDAWRDPPNLEAICKRIEKYAQMEYDLLEAAIRKAKGETS